MAEEKDKPSGDENEDFAFPSEDFQTSGDSSPQDQGSDFGSGGEEEDLGGLPPLSDFESSGETSDEEDDFGSLPPLSDIQVETPVPGGGKPQKSTPASGGAFATPASDSDLDTPMPGGLETPQEDEDTTAFQDLAADSDFSPETPEIGPGPDTDLETPMFDSAFGGGADDFGTPASSTDAPTQAMETPMFGESSSSGGDFGFDDNAFGGGGADPFAAGAGAGAGAAAGAAAGRGFDAGTPVPDFSPDTGVGQPTPPPTGGDTGKGKKKAKGGKGGGVSAVVFVAALLIVLLLGLVGGQFFSMPFNPNKGEIEQLNQQIAQKDTQIQRLLNAAPATGPGDEGVDQETLINERAQLLEEIQQYTEDRDAAVAAAEQAEATNAEVQRDLDELNNSYVTTRSDYENLQNQLSITRAQQEGLLSEIDRFQNLVGDLDEANTRRIMTKDTLQSAVDRLAVTINEGLPLTPSKYNRDERIERVNELRNQVADSNWVSPELLDAYTNLYLDEMEIAQSREYFFAQIPVSNRYGYIEQKWAECLMNGNWGVYFRTLDGRQVGVYQNTSQSNVPDYKFVQFDDAVEKQIEQEIVANRPPDFDQKISVIAERAVANDNRTTFQRGYDSL
jgi:hypothetical protein